MHDFTHQYELIINVNGKALDEYEHGPDIFVEGRRDSPFEIVFKNNSYERVFVVFSVDGLSVMDGRPAGLQSNGLIVDGFSKCHLFNWYDNTQLQFGGKSYQTRSNNQTDNVGVFGALVFREQPVVIHAYNYNPVMYQGWTEANNLSIASSTSIDNKILLNTTKLDQYDSFVKRDSNNPDAMMVINYDSARGLEKRGIVLKHKSPHTEQPFPTYRRR